MPQRLCSGRTRRASDEERGPPHACALASHGPSLTITSICAFCSNSAQYVVADAQSASSRSARALSPRARLQLGPSVMASRSFSGDGSASDSRAKGPQAETKVGRGLFWWIVYHTHLDYEPSAASFPSLIHSAPRPTWIHRPRAGTDTLLSIQHDLASRAPADFLRLMARCCHRA